MVPNGDSVACAAKSIALLATPVDAFSLSNIQRSPTSSFSSFVITHRHQNLNSPALQSTNPFLIDICSAFALESFSIIANCLRNNIYRSQFTPAISTVKMPGYTQELDAVSNAAMNGSVQGFALHLLSLDEYSLTDLPQIRRHIPSHRCHRSSFSPIIALGRLQSRATSFLHARGDRRHIAKGDAATDQRFRCSVRCCGE